MEKRNRSESGKYWPWMILGFLFIGITLGYWTVRHSVGMPVNESNEYMMKYQKADRNAEAIVEAQQKFDAKYSVEAVKMKKSDFKPEHLKRKAGAVVALENVNTFSYRVERLDGSKLSDANVTLLLTRPHTDKDDQLFENIPYKDGLYSVKNVVIEKPGRYILRLRVQIGDAVGFMDTEAYLKPE